MPVRNLLYRAVLQILFFSISSLVNRFCRICPAIGTIQDQGGQRLPEEYDIGRECHSFTQGIQRSIGVPDQGIFQGATDSADWITVDQGDVLIHIVHLGFQVGMEPNYRMVKPQFHPCPHLYCRNDIG